MALLPKAICIFNAIAIKTPTPFFAELELIRLKFFMKPSKTLNGQSNLENENQNQRHQTPWIQTISQSHSNQNSMVLMENKHIDQRNRTGSLEVNPSTYGLYKGKRQPPN